MLTRALSSSGGGLKTVSTSFGPILTTQSTFTVTGLSKISSIATYYGTTMIDATIVDDNGTIIAHYASPGSQFGVSDISGNTFKFIWNNSFSSFDFYVNGI